MSYKHQIELLIKEYEELTTDKPKKMFEAGFNTGIKACINDLKDLIDRQEEIKELLKKQGK